MALSGLTEGVASHAVWHSLTAAWRRAFGGTIKITSPSVFRNPELRNDGILAYEVHGTLKRLPTNHKVWLLIKDGLGEEVKPQGFKEADQHEDNGQWGGWINGAGRKRATVIAVVAPPTSRDFFAYWQKHGKQTGFAALTRVPPECRNRAEVSVDLISS